jgi:hypothetical protein
MEGLTAPNGGQNRFSRYRGWKPRSRSALAAVREKPFRSPANDSRPLCSKFVELARSVYRDNDRRAAIKKRINVLLGSKIIEEKSYAGTLCESAAV